MKSSTPTCCKKENKNLYIYIYIYIYITKFVQCNVHPQFLGGVFLTRLGPPKFLLLLLLLSRLLLQLSPTPPTLPLLPHFLSFSFLSFFITLPSFLFFSLVSFLSSVNDFLSTCDFHRMSPISSLCLSIYLTSHSSIYLSV